jgi:hypothetical protein
MGIYRKIFFFKDLKSLRDFGPVLGLREGKPPWETAKQTMLRISTEREV